MTKIDEEYNEEDYYYRKRQSLQEVSNNDTIQEA